MTILSIQSHVAYGHVGNAAAVFPLQRLGFEVWPIHTVQFSNHTGYPDWQGEVFSAPHIRALVEGIAARGVLPDCRAVLSGYLGSLDLGEAVLDTVARLRQANPDLVYLLDPVMGDEEPGLYLAPEVADFLRHKALPQANIITPNLFELRHLVGRPIDSLDAALTAALELSALGPRLVMATSLLPPLVPDDKIGMLVVERCGQGTETGDAAWLVLTPRLRLPEPSSGAGDLVAALLLAQHLRGLTPDAALEQVAASVFATLEVSHAAGSRELCLIAAQDALVNPPRRFPVERL